MSERDDLSSLLGPDENIVILGPPGGGKTSLAKVLSRYLSLSIYDIDDDHLEQVWGCTVASKLTQLGDDLFVQAEGEALCLVKKTRTVISLSGSNPLHEAGMRTLRENNPNSIFLYLDVSRDDIIQRLEAMKVNRIVGQATRQMSEILDWRASFYEKYYDLRVLVPKRSSQDQVSSLALSTLGEFLRARREHVSLGGRYISTRQPTELSTSKRMKFGDAVLQGLAEDGGLFVPSSLPKIELGQISRLAEFAASDNYAEFALRVLEKFVFSFELKPQLLREFIAKAYNPARWNDHRIANLQQLPTTSGRKQYLLELFHGPTGSFKDFALQLFPLIFDHFAKSKTNQRGKKFAILVSTSGDTGSATMDGFCSQTEIPIVVLFPADGVSPVQRAQMVSSTFSNLRVLPIAAPADFDFCQSTLKQLFNDSSFIQQLGDEFNLSVSAANSINWGRLLPQIAYHVFAFASLVARGDVSVTELVDVCVPTGNFGNILAALYARSCGVPIGTLICATNENDVLREFIQTGTYDIRNRSLQPTSSPSIDILKSSNLERMLHLIEGGGRDGSSIASYFNDLSAPEKQSFTVKASTFEQVRALFTSGTCRQDQAVDVIKSEFQKSNVVFDPHTAVAKHVADENQQGDKAEGRPIIICATAHYVKFPSTVLHALGREASGDLKSQLTELSHIVSEANSVPKIHDRVKDCCFADEVQSQPIAASKEAIHEETLSFFRKLFN